MEKPLVCVCIPCYNAEKTIEETLKTIREQTYLNIEIHIFDNASKDQTVEVIKSISDDRIYFHHVEFTGTAESNFTRCLNLGRGEYTAIFHSDDLYAPDMVEKEVAFLQSHSEAGGVLTFANLINEDSEIMRAVSAPAYLKLGRGEASSFDLLMLFRAVLRDNNFFFCPSAMIRTEVCVEVLQEWRGELFGPGADLDTWFRIAEAGELGLINLPLLQYRISKAHFSYDYNRLNTGRADLFTVLDYWMKKTVLSDYINGNDMRWYQRWLMRDDVVRANNATRKGELNLAKSILKEVSLVQLLKDAMSSLRGLKFGSLFLLAVVKSWVL